MKTLEERKQELADYTNHVKTMSPDELATEADRIAQAADITIASVWYSNSQLESIVKRLAQIGVNADRVKNHIKQIKLNSIHGLTE